MQDGHLAENKNACRVFLIERREKKERKKTAKGDPLPSQISYKERGLSLCY